MISYLLLEWSCYLVIEQTSRERQESRILTPDLVCDNYHQLITLKYPICALSTYSDPLMSLNNKPHNEVKNNPI